MHGPILDKTYKTLDINKDFVPNYPRKTPAMIVLALCLPSRIGQAGFERPWHIFVRVIMARQVELTLICLGSLVTLLAGSTK